MNEPNFVKWVGSSFDDIDLLEQRLTDCGNDFSDVCTDGRMVCTEDEDGAAETLSSMFVAFASVRADRSLSVR